MGADTHGEEYPAGSIGSHRLEIQKKFHEMYASMAESLYKEGVRATRNKVGAPVFRMMNGQDVLADSTLWDDLFKLQGQKNAARFCSNEVEDFPAPACAQMPNVHGLEPEQIPTRFPINVKWRENLPSLEEDEGYKQIAEYSGAVVELAIAAKKVIEVYEQMRDYAPQAIKGPIATLRTSLQVYDNTVLKMGKALGV